MKITLITLLLTFSVCATAEVSRIEVLGEEVIASPDSALQYRAIRGVLHFSLDPQESANTLIADIGHAPRNTQGLVGFSTDFRLLVPLGPPSSSVLLYNVNNRGRSRFPPEVSLTHPLSTMGHSYLATGWINELAPGQDRLRLHAPVVSAADGPITGQVRYEITVGAPDNDANIAGARHLAYTPTQQGLANATLSYRVNQDDPRIAMDRDAFRLAVTEVSDSTQPRVTLQVAGGLRPGLIYELIYEARDPVLAGAGMAGIRDAVALLRHGSADAGLSAQLADLALPSIDHTVAWGNSQSGRLLRLFVYQGFNTDLHGRRVFDGVVPVIAGAGFGMFNMRFAMPTRTSGQHENLLFPSDLFPFTYGESTDPFTGRTDGILRRTRQAGTVPRVMHIQTSNEYWVRGGSLPHTNPSGTADADIPAEVRFYTIGGSQHGSGSGSPGAAGRGQLPDNPNRWAPISESLIAAMVEWVRDGRLPPPSLYPRIEDGTLVASHLANGEINPAAWQSLPGIRHPGTMYQVAYGNYGERFASHGIIDRHPLSTDQYYGARVPAVGADNNDFPYSTVLPPLTAVPLATFVPWNLRAARTGAETELARLAGGYIPLPASAAGAVRAGDPRPALNSLYRDFGDYLHRYEQATDELIRRGYLLPAFRESFIDIARGNAGLFGL